MLLFLFTAALYARALHFGFIWDDPVWFYRVAGKSLWELITPLPEYHFYRPGTLLINRAFMRGDGTFDPVPMHAFQIGVHLLNVALVARLCRELRFGRGVALATAAFFALYPLSHQAVAWAAPQHAWVMLLSFISASTYVIARRQSRPALLAGSLIAYLLALSVQESAIQLLPLLFLFEWRVRGRFRVLWRSAAPWLFVIVSLGYLAFWLWAPKYEGVTTLAFDPEVAWYLLQGLAYPVAGLLGGIPEWAGGGMAAAFIGLVSILLLRRRYWALAIGGVWALCEQAATWVGLDYAYVNLSSRQFYLSAFGVALLWAAALSPDCSRPRRRLWDVAGWAALALILVQGVWLLTGFQQMYAHGATVQSAMLDVLATADEEDSLLFVNYPDRFEPYRRPYPLGYWGLTLAPVRVELADFALLTTGYAPHTESLSVLSLGLEGRDAGPYYVNMRGAPVAESTVYERAREVDAVYLVSYHSDGTMTLSRAGAVRKGLASGEAPVARLGDVAELLSAGVSVTTDGVCVDLEWHALAAGTSTDAVFLHLTPPGEPPAAQADGAPGQGLLPLWTWKPGDLIEESRCFVPVNGEIPPGAYLINVGIYNWETQTRLPVYLPEGSVLPDGVFTAGWVRVPEG